MHTTVLGGAWTCQSTFECHCMCYACLKLSWSPAVLFLAGGVTINTYAKRGTCKQIRKCIFQPWCQCLFKVQNNGEKSIIDVLISSTQMTQLPKKIRKAFRSFPQLSCSGGGRGEQRTGKQVTSSFWALPPPMWLHWGILISYLSISSHVQLAQIKNTWTYIVQLGPVTFPPLPFLFFPGTALQRKGRYAGCSVNISKIYFSSDTWGSCIFNCNFAFYLLGKIELLVL